MLLNTYPVASVIPDVFGKTPVDYAEANQLDAPIIDALKKVAKHCKPVRSKLRQKTPARSTPTKEHLAGQAAVEETERTSMMTESCADEEVPLREVPSAFQKTSRSKSS